MWNKLSALLQEPATKRLAIALFVSAILHSLFFGNMRSLLPSFKKEMHTIEARIQMPKAVTPPAEKAPEENPEKSKAPPPAEKPAKEKVPEPKPAKEEPISEQIEETPPEANSNADTKPAEEPAKQNAAENVTQNDPQLAEQNPAENLPQPDDTGLVINENAYQYIETEFDLFAEKNGKPQGKAKITYNLVDGKNYQINWLTEGRGVVALFLPDLLQTSTGELTKTGLRPNQYQYQFGNKADKNRTAVFDWQTKKVTLTTAKGSKTEDLPEDTQDLLSFMYQFMYVAPLQHMQLPIVNGKKLRVYDYSFEGEEQLNSALGEMRTIHIMHSTSDDERTDIWLAINYQYAPVKIVKTESDGKVIEMLATSVTTNRPVVDAPKDTK